MASGGSRRDFIQLVGAAVAGSTAGCGARDTGDQGITVTPAPVPSTTPKATNELRARPAELASRIEFDVTVLIGFSKASPAGLEISVGNRTERQVTALAGSRFVLPFVDRDYVGTDRSGAPGLLLAPNPTRLIVDPKAGAGERLTAALPEAPIDGCWTLPFEWPAALRTRDATLQFATLVPGEHRDHRYRLYFIEDWAPGTFTFQNRFDLTVGRTREDRELYLARLGFEVTVTDDRDVQVVVRDPVIASPRSSADRK
jgi:hypothetical protein